MINRIIKAKKKNFVFVLEIKEGYLKVLKCLIRPATKREFLGIELAVLAPDSEDGKVIETINQIFKKLEYNNDPVILSLPRNYATCRNIKIPAQSKQEIDRIASLQSSRYLPYPSNELITGYQVISTDKDGYSLLNLTIVHKDIIERYIKIFNELKVPRLAIVLSSYGICNFYNYINPKDHDSVMVAEIDSNNVELVVISKNIMQFSRYFKLNRQQPNWENPFISEINKTRDAYLKELSIEAPKKIIIFGPKSTPGLLMEILNKESSFSAEAFSYSEKTNIPKNILEIVLGSDCSLASLMGLGMQDTEESLNLLPSDMKEKIRRTLRFNERIRTGILIFTILVIWLLAVAKNLQNKQNYLNLLKAELNKIAKEAKPLEDIVKRFSLIESRSKKKPTILEILRELYKIIPEQVTLINFNYEENDQLTLRGQATELNTVFALVSQLEKSAIFKNFNMKVRYATKRRSQLGDFVDFEISCTKK